MRLPPAILEAWASDDPGKLAGFLELAGIDPERTFRSRAVLDHPWLGLEVEFPFAEVGRGKIVRCLIHPRGQLLFDVAFPQPVPPIQGAAPNFHVALKDYPDCHQAMHRFWGHELKTMLERKEDQPSP